MADYYSILKKTISGLGKNTPEVRLAVYGKARIAIERQLRGITPAPSEAAIASQLDALEKAIEAIDLEYASVADVPAPEPIPAPPPFVEELPPRVSEARPEPTLPAAEEVSSPQVDAPSAASASSSDFSRTVDRQDTAAPTPSEPIMDVTSDRSASTSSEKSAPSVKTTAGALDAMSSAVRMDSNSSSAPDTASLEAMPEPEVSGGKKPKRGIGKIVLPIVVLALLGGAGYAVWVNKDDILGASGNLVAEVSDTAEETSLGTSEPDGEASVEKEPVRIGSNGEDTSAGPIDESATASEETEVPVIEEAPRIIKPIEPEQPVQEEIAETPIVEPEVEPEPEQPVVDPVDVQPEQPAVAPIGEVAYLYEEGSAGSGATRTNAGVTWAIERQQIEQGSTPEPVIIGTMDVPEKDMSIGITIKRNVDEALSASHLIEVRFNTPEGFSGQGVEEIARFVMKSTEEARGEALVAVPVKVSDGFFLVALDNLPQAVDVNTQLMTSSSWIDIPVSYTSGKRALLTLEKGSDGDSAFKEAFADWKNR